MVKDMGLYKMDVPTEYGGPGVDLVTRTLRDHITGTIDLEPTQVQSLSILAKTSGMYTTRIEDVTERSSDDIASDLKRKLSQLALVTDDDVDDEVSDVTH